MVHVHVYVYVYAYVHVYVCVPLNVCVTTRARCADWCARPTYDVCDGLCCIVTGRGHVVYVTYWESIADLTDVLACAVCQIS